MDFQPFLDHLKSLLAEQGITLVFVLGATSRLPGKREVAARPADGGLELTAADPATAKDAVVVLDQHVEVTRNGDRIHVSVS